MGCVQGRQARSSGDGPPATITLGGYGGGVKNKTGQGYQTMAADPDLGWRRLPSSVAIPMGGVAAGIVCNNPTEWTSSSPPANGRSGKNRASNVFSESGRHQDQQESLYPSRSAWNVCFFNDRSGHFCNVSIITLSINIAIRAEGLAKAFGIVSDPDIFQPRQTSITSTEALTKESEDAPESHQKIYNALRVPDAGWRLLSRRGSENCQSEGSGVLREFKKKGVTGDKSSRRSLKEESKDNRKVTPQLIRRGPSGEPVWADVPEIGMNIAEQLYRLERRQDNRHFLPTDTFGWRFGEMEIEERFRVAVSSPEGEAFWLIPEELIMNVTQWVQQTYLTSTAF